MATLARGALARLNSALLFWPKANWNITRHVVKIWWAITAMFAYLLWTFVKSKALMLKKRWTGEDQDELADGEEEEESEISFDNIPTSRLVNRRRSWTVNAVVDSRTEREPGAGAPRPPSLPTN